MCLGIPGQVVEIHDAEKKLGVVDVAGVRRVTNLACVVDGRAVEDCVGDWVLVHVGFAMSRIDPEEARRTLELLTELGEMQDELRQMKEGAGAPMPGPPKPSPPIPSKGAGDG